MLDHALRSGGPERTDLDRVAMRLARFYGGLASVPSARPPRAGGWYEQEIELCARELGRTEFGIDGARIERIVGRLRDFLRARPELLVQRHRARHDRRGPRRSAARAYLPRAHAGDHRLSRVQPSAAHRRSRGRARLPRPRMRHAGSAGRGRAPPAQLRDDHRRSAAGAAGRLVHRRRARWSVRGCARSTAASPARGRRPSGSARRRAISTARSPTPTACPEAGRTAPAPRAAPRGAAGGSPRRAAARRRAR